MNADSTRKDEWSQYLHSDPEITQNWSDTVAFIDGVFSSFHAIDNENIPATWLST